MRTDTAAFDLLHTLALKGMAGTDGLAAGTAFEPAELAAELERLRDLGLATHLERRGQWRLTPAGQRRHAELLADELPSCARDRLYPPYQAFLPLNDRIKDACTRWQLRDGAPNDHSDACYDAAIVAELGELHTEAVAVLAGLAAVRERFARYGERLTSAMHRLRGGELRAFTGVLCESYHDVWMELHRDLLLSLGIERDAERRVEH